MDKRHISTYERLKVAERDNEKYRKALKWIAFYSDTVSRARIRQEINDVLRSGKDD